MMTTHTPDRYELQPGERSGAQAVHGLVMALPFDSVRRRCPISPAATQSDFPRTSTAGLAAIRDYDAATPAGARPLRKPLALAGFFIRRMK